MDNNYTRIAIILDRSGSMSSIANTASSTLNEFITKQKSLPGKVKLKLVQFDEQYEVSFDDWLDNVPKIELIPRGMTALYDAQGKTITELGKELAETPEDKRPGKVMVVIITDGQENSSRKYRHTQIANMIKHQQDKYNWDFVSLASNQDAIAVGSTFNIPRTKSMTFQSSVAGVTGASIGLNNYATMYRSFMSAAEASVNSVFDEKDRSASLQSDTI